MAGQSFRLRSDCIWRWTVRYFETKSSCSSSSASSTTTAARSSHERLQVLGEVRRKGASASDQRKTCPLCGDLRYPLDGARGRSRWREAPEWPFEDQTGSTDPSTPSQDILLHSGDLTKLGSDAEVKSQIDWLVCVRLRRLYAPELSLTPLHRLSTQLPPTRTQDHHRRQPRLCARQQRWLVRSSRGQNPRQIRLPSLRHGCCAQICE